MNDFTLRKAILILGCLVHALILSSCTKHDQLPTTRILPSDSSFFVAMEATCLLSASCVPNCWPRDFTAKNPQSQYIAYIMPGNHEEKVRRVSTTRKALKGEVAVDTSFNQLIKQFDQINYQKYAVEDVRPLSNQRVKIGLIDKPRQELADNELGYLRVSPVVTNKKGDEAVFVYELYGEFFTSWLICSRLKRGKWIIVSKSRLAVS